MSESTAERTPNGQWAKGHSGNPETQFQEGNQAAVGRRGAITKLFAEIFEDAVCTEAVKQQIVKTLTSKGMAGVLLLKEAAERIEGKITQPVEHSGEIGIADTITDARKRAGLEVIDITDAA